MYKRQQTDRQTDRQTLRETERDEVEEEEEDILSRLSGQTSVSFTDLSQRRWARPALRAIKRRVLGILCS